MLEFVLVGLLDYVRVSCFCLWWDVGEDKMRVRLYRDNCCYEGSRMSGGEMVSGRWRWFFVGVGEKGVSIVLWSV